MAQELEKMPTIPRKFTDKRYSSEWDSLPQVVSFSGGRTSALMLRRLLDQGVRPIVLFANTGKERDETLDFVEDVSSNFAVEVVWLEYCRQQMVEEILAFLPTEKRRDYWRKQGIGHWFKVTNYQTACRVRDANSPFDKLLEWASVLPNPRARICTAELKIRTMMRYLWSQRIYRFVNFIGIRSDEAERATEIVRTGPTPNVVYRFPLIEQPTTEADVLEYWRGQDFDLKLKPYEGNCHLCFLKKAGAKRRLILEQPDLWQWWVSQEKKKKKVTDGGIGSQWRADHTVESLVVTAKLDEYDGKEYAMECSCTSGVGLGSLIDDEVDEIVASARKPTTAFDEGAEL